jgi:cold shock CspA family protein
MSDATTPRQSGTVNFFNHLKGYGFITIDNQRDIFMHISEWLHDDEPQKGQRVSFVEGVSRDRRPVAQQIMPS